MTMGASDLKMPVLDMRVARTTIRRRCPVQNPDRNQFRRSRGLRKMLKHIGMPIAVASIAAIMALAWMMIIDPDLVAGQGSQSARAHITVQIGSGDDTVSWYDPDGCTSKYNLYLYVNTPVQGSSTGQTTRTHLGSAPSGSTQATLPISHGVGSPFYTPYIKVELYCGEYDSSSSQNDLVATTSLSVGGSGLRFGTFSSAPLDGAERKFSNSFPFVQQGPRQLQSRGAE